MAKRIDAMFVLLGAVFLLAGMTLGEVMGGTQDHSQLSTHAHLNLPGGVFAILFGLCYRAWPSLKTNLAVVHFFMHLVGAPLMVAGLWLIFGPLGEAPSPVGLTIAGSMIILAGMLLFAVRIAGKVTKPE